MAQELRAFLLAPVYNYLNPGTRPCPARIFLEHVTFALLIMEPPSFCQLRARSLFALFFVSSFAAKLLHLYSHRSSLPILLIVLYTPTFLLPDFLLIVFGKFLYRQNRGKIWKFLGGLLA